MMSFSSLYLLSTQHQLTEGKELSLGCFSEGDN